MGARIGPAPSRAGAPLGAAVGRPSAAIDLDPYTGSIDAGTNSVQLTSGEVSIAAFPGSALTLTKQFTPLPDSGAIDVTYTLANTSTSVAVSVGPWQISRVAATGGLTFFGQGDGAPSYASGSNPTFSATEVGGDLWYEFSPVVSNSKMLADGVGWIAHVTESRLLYLLAYPDVQPTDVAPGEAEVEIFTGTGGDYAELETQGALTDLAPGDTSVWTVRWKLRQLPSGTSVAVGSSGLTSFASVQLGQ